MGGACGTYRRQESFMQGFGGETCGKETNCKIQGVDGSIILKWIFKEWHVEVWTGLIWLMIGTGGR
jgi:hypothetical protein